MEKQFRVVESEGWRLKCLQIGMTQTYDELMKGFNIKLENWDGSVENLNQLLEEDKYKGKGYKLIFEEVEEPTLIEKIAKHFGVKIGEEFNIYHGDHEDITISFNPYKFTEKTLCNCYGNFVPDVMNNLILGEYTLRKFPKF